MARKTWTQKFDGAKPPHVAVLEKPYAGAPAGARLYISSPAEVAAYMAAIPRGEVRTAARMRADLAARAGAEATCPTSSGIFTRIAAERALEQMAAGARPAEVAPFWRLIDPASPAAAKLSCGAAGLAALRETEAG